MYGKNIGQLKAEMDVAMGGRAAEELVFGQEKVTTGMLLYRSVFVAHAIPWCAHTTPRPKQLHWLPVKACTSYKIARI